MSSRTNIGSVVHDLAYSAHGPWVLVLTYIQDDGSAARGLAYIYSSERETQVIWSISWRVLKVV